MTHPVEMVIRTKKIVFAFLFLSFQEGVFAQATTKSYENLNSDKNEFVYEEAPFSQNISPTSTKTTSLNGKIEAGPLGLSGVTSLSLTLEFEKPIVNFFQNQTLMWLLQGRGELLIAGDPPAMPCLIEDKDCLQQKSDQDDSNPKTIIGSAYTGFKYTYFNILTASITFGRAFVESDFFITWTTLSIGCNIMDTAHLELHMRLPGLYPQPIGIALSIGIPLKAW